MPELEPPVDSVTVAKTHAPVTKIRPALLRYRILAWITGLWLLLLVVEMVLNYGFENHTLDFVPVVHGWVYALYLVMMLDLAIKVRWPLGKSILTAIAGTVPFLSFIVEHQRTKEVKAQFQL